ncbi:MAG: 2-dehydropantoate 2-reductase [Deltaproteobacteria bacterium]|nr:2-dehydropantoate 2-reductase [Deltaproteobacteria bacterium]
MKDKIKLLVVGSGAIGSFYGGKLARTGLSVSLLCRSDYEVVKRDGVSVRSYQGDFHFSPAQVISSAAEYKEKADYVLVCLKVLPKVDLVGIIRDAVHPETAIVLIQNGIEIEPDVKKAFPQNEIISAIAFICVNRLEFGLVDHLDYGRMEMGLYPDGTSQKTERLAGFFKEAGVPCRLSEKIIGNRWQKLLWNVPFNSLSVIGGLIDTKKIMDSPEAVALVRKIMAELILLAGKTGYFLDEDLIERMIADTKKMEPYKTSMLLDYEAKREIEVEAILGNVIKIAKKQQLSLPYIESLYGCLKLLDDQNRSEGL